MSAVFSTQTVQQRERVPYWVEVATKAFYRHEFNASRSSFFGDLAAHDLACLDLVHCDFGACEVVRSRRDVVRDGVDTLIMDVRLSGRSLITQNEREVLHAPGSLVLIDSAQPLNHTFTGKTESVFVSIPRNALQARIGTFVGGAHPLTGSEPIVGLLFGFVSMVAARIHELDDAARNRLGEQLLDLIALAISEERGDAVSALASPRAVALLRLKAAIESRLCNPDLRPAEAAASAGISVRYANDLLAHEGSSLERYVLHRRLERCRRALEDPAQSSRMIGEIAFAWGFSELSHFVRRFRRAYGMAPRDYRRHALEQGPGAQRHEAVAIARPGEPVR